MRFLSLAGYYRKFCNFFFFFFLSAPLTDPLKKNCKFVSNKTLKTLRRCLVMHQCFWLQIFVNHLNLLLMLVMLVLLQEDENGIDRSVCYFSHKFNKHQKVCAMIEKKCLVLIRSFQFF